MRVASSNQRRGARKESERESKSQSDSISSVIPRPDKRLDTARSALGSEGRKRGGKKEMEEKNGAMERKDRMRKSGG